MINENIDIFLRSLVEIVNVISLFETIHLHILSEGVTCIKVKPMDGMHHLIIFDTINDKQKFIESKWLDSWFYSLKDIWDSSHLSF